jgi:uncharacterized repeat protein (TIGR01451 family)
MPNTRIIEMTLKTALPSIPFHRASAVACAYLLLALAFFWPAHALAQTGPDFSATPTLESGTALQQGAVYRFANVLPGIDARVTLGLFTNVTTLDVLDNPAFFPTRFQPVIRCNATANITCWVRFDFQFVATGTNTPAPIPKIAASAQDLDSGPGTTREFVEFTGATAVTVATPTSLVSAPALAGGTRFIQGAANNIQAGIGTDNSYEVYASYPAGITAFSIIGGNTIANVACVPATPNSCNRLNSYSFVPFDSNLASIIVRKTSTGGTGTFAFSGTNGYASQSITTTVAGTPAAALPQPLTPGATTITEAAPTGFSLNAITCTGLGTGGTQTPTINGVNGGSVLLNAAATVAGSDIVCTFTNAIVAADVSITKTNTPGVNGNVDQAADTVASGVTTAYSIVVSNAGPSAANNTVLRDPVPTGLTCSAVTCGTPTGGAVCPAVTLAALQAPAGVTIATLPANSSLTFTLTCAAQ